LQNEETIQASLAIPMAPARGSGDRTGTGSPLEADLRSSTVAAALPHAPAHRDLSALRHEAVFRREVPSTDAVAH
jgi:hypothetical protein